MQTDDTRLISYLLCLSLIYLLWQLLGSSWWNERPPKPAGRVIVKLNPGLKCPIRQTEMFLPKHDFSQLVVLNKIFLHKQVVPLHLQILAMYFLVYSTEGQSILYCCLSDYKPCRKQFHNWQDKWCKLSCRIESHWVMLLHLQLIIFSRTYPQIRVRHCTFCFVL